MSVAKLEKDPGKPEKSLTYSIKRKKGRSGGKISVRHKGGGHKRRYREIDFRMDKLDIPAVIARIERDPNRSANIALLQYADGEKRYSVAVSGMKEGQKILTAEKTPVKIGNRAMLKNIPIGTQICLVELFSKR